MARALMDFTAEMFNGEPEKSVFARDIGAMFNALSAFGLRVVGSAPSPIENPDVIRLVFEETRPAVLPAECAEGWCLAQATFIVESVGGRYLIRVSEVRIVGKPRLALAA